MRKRWEILKTEPRGPKTPAVPPPFPYLPAGRLKEELARQLGRLFHGRLGAEKVVVGMAGVRVRAPGAGRAAEERPSLGRVFRVARALCQEISCRVTALPTPTRPMAPPRTMLAPIAAPASYPYSQMATIV